MVRTIQSVLAAGFFLLCQSVALLSSSFAQLTWDNPDREFHPRPEAARLTTEFGFKNTGSRLVSIKAVQTTCGCVTTALDKKDYTPGESGRIVVTMNFGSQTGLKQESVVVVTDDPKSPVTELKLRAQIPEVLKITPVALQWNLGDAPEPKTIKLLVAGDQPVRIVSVESSHDDIFPKLKTVHPGREYEIAVKPLATANPIVATLEIIISFPDKTQRSFQVHAQVGQS